MNITRPMIDWTVWSFGFVVCIRPSNWLIGIAIGPFHFGFESSNES